MSPLNQSTETEKQRLDRVYPLVTCRLCNKRERAQYMEPTRGNMIQKKLCFKCNFWAEHYLIRTLGNGKSPGGGLYLICKRNDTGEGEVLHQYIAYPFAPKGYTGMVGFGGSTIYFKLQDGTLFKSNNVWRQGSIPNHLHHLFPINAEWVTEREYNELRK